MKRTLNNKKYYTPFFALRRPILSLDGLDIFYKETNSKHQNDIARSVLERFNTPLMLEALYLATPVLYDEVMKILQSDISDAEVIRIGKSLLKYFIRASSRCTPFGLFSCCGVGDVVENGLEPLITTSELKRHLRLDMDYLCSLGSLVAEKSDVKVQLTYYPNSSLFKFKNGYRYVEYRLNQEGYRNHHLINIKADDLLSFILKSSNNGIRLNDLIELILHRYEVEPSEVEAYINNLVEQKVLVHNLQPNVTGEEYLKTILDVLETLPNQTDQVREIYHTISTLDKEVVSIGAKTSQVSSYRIVKEKLSQFDLPIKEEKLFQLDTIDTTETYTISNDLVAEVYDVIETISAFSTDNRETRLQKFKRAFKERYEDRLVSLGEALDSEIGLGYKHATSTEDYYGVGGNVKGDFDRFRSHVYHQYLRDGNRIIRIREEDLSTYFPNRKGRLPNTFSALINVYADSQLERLAEIIIVSPSTTNLLGRFCHADKNLMNKVKDLTDFEAKTRSEEIIAEIAHLPQSRVGNVLSRPHLRAYEIEYLAQSTLPNEYRIRLADLYIKIQDDRIVLYSKRLKKVIAPRLASAHNFSYNSLPVYNFLGDLQTQDSIHLESWNWGGLSSEDYLPRIQYKNVILSPARWLVKTSSIFPSKKDWLMFDVEFRNVVMKNSIPNRVIYAESDHRLLLDLSNPMCIEMIKGIIKKTGSITFLETCWWDVDKAFLKDKNGASFGNELVIPYTSYEKPKAKIIQPDLKTSKICRTFMPGSEWVYFKVYFNLSSDKLILKLNDFAKANKSEIDKWFFIRYTDPKPHLRIRYHLRDAKYNNQILKNFHKKFSAEITSNKIYRIVIDTYEREIERYGEERMLVSESLFHLNSEFVVNLLAASGSINFDQDIVVMKAIDHILKLFGFMDDDKLRFCKQMFNAYGIEFGYQKSKPLKENFQSLFRNKSKTINELMLDDIPKSLERIVGLINYRRKLEPLVQQIVSKIDSEITLERYIASQIHMFVNRAYQNDQRFKELTIYYLLQRFYNSNLHILNVR